MRQPIDLDYFSKAIVGIASPVLGVITSLQEQIEWTLAQETDGYINATSMCQAAGKEWSGYMRNAATKEFMAELEGSPTGSSRPRASTGMERSSAASCWRSKGC